MLTSVEPSFFKKIIMKTRPRAQKQNYKQKVFHILFTPTPDICCPFVEEAKTKSTAEHQQPLTYEYFYVNSRYLPMGDLRTLHATQIVHVGLLACMFLKVRTFRILINQKIKFRL